VLDTGHAAVQWLRGGGRGVRARWVLACLVALVAQLAVIEGTAEAASGSIAGTVTESAAPHNPIESVEVCAFPSAPENAEGGLLGEFEEFCAKTDATGKYDIPGLAPGLYEVGVFPQAVKPLDFVAQDLEAKVTSGASTGLNIALAEGGVIEGRVTNARSGQPVPGIVVCAAAAVPSIGGFECAQSGADGTYSILGLAAGEYQVAFLPGETEYELQFYNNTSNPNDAQEVSVSAGKSNATKNIDGALDPLGSIVGVVTSDGLPLVGVHVCALLVVTEAVECTATGLQGEYALHDLQPVQYNVGFALSGYQTQYYNDKFTFAEAQEVQVQGLQATGPIDAAMTRPAVKAMVQPVVPPPGGAPAATSPPLESVPASVGALSLGAKDIAVKSSVALVKLKCSKAQTCRGKITLAVKRIVEVKGKKKVRSVSIGSASFSIHGTATVRIRLNPAARQLLGAGHGRLSARLTLLGIGGSPAHAQVKAVELVQPKGH
jgi:Carboxypeptidase regulatory-like domain